MPIIRDDFTPGPSPYWQPFLAGSGELELSGRTLRLVNGATTSRCYTNAQIDDYRSCRRRDFPWRPPLTLIVRARFSHPSAAGVCGSKDAGMESRGPEALPGGRHLSGTAGFGFWNDPFMMSGARPPALPRAIWFFYSSPQSDMRLDVKTPGCGWKAATIDAIRLPFFLLAPTAPLAIPLMRLRPLYRRLWPLAQRAIRVSEALVDAPMTEWHTYAIQWGKRVARFTVDGSPVLVCNTPPRGPLGLVIWLDNQYLVVTPWGRFRYGWIEAPGPQWMELDLVQVEGGRQ